MQIHSKTNLDNTEPGKLTKVKWWNAVISLTLAHMRRNIKDGVGEESFVSMKRADDK